MSDAKNNQHSLRKKFELLADDFLALSQERATSKFASLLSRFTGSDEELSLSEVGPLFEFRRKFEKLIQQGGDCALLLYEMGPLREIPVVAERMTALQIGIPDIPNTPSNFFSFIVGGSATEFASPNVTKADIRSASRPRSLHELYERDSDDRKLPFVIPDSEQCERFSDFCRHISQNEKYWLGIEPEKKLSADIPHFIFATNHHDEQLRKLAVLVNHALADPNDRRSMNKIALDFMRDAEIAKSSLGALRKYEKRKREDVRADI